MAKKQTNEQYVDFHAQACGVCDVEEFYDEIEDRLNEEPSITRKVQTLSSCPACVYLIKQLFYLRWFNPIGFDMLCLKTIEPRLTYEDIARNFRTDQLKKQFVPTRAVWKSRARVSEAVKEMECVKQVITERIDTVLKERES